MLLSVTIRKYLLLTMVNIVLKSRTRQENMYVPSAAVEVKMDMEEMTWFSWCKKWKIHFPLPLGVEVSGKWTWFSWCKRTTNSYTTYMPAMFWDVVISDNEEIFIVDYGQHCIEVKNKTGGHVRTLAAMEVEMDNSIILLV